MALPDLGATRRCVLAVSVLRDIDVVPTDEGLLLPGPDGALLDWTWVHEAAVGSPGAATGLLSAEEAEADARLRVEHLLRLHLLIGEIGTRAAQVFHTAARLVALPPGHAQHPGDSWRRERLRGGALELGIGVTGLLPEADSVLPLPSSVAARVGIPAASWWPEVRDHADRMGALASSRLRRDGPRAVIRPVGGCDVLALLASRTLRRHLAAADGSGLCSVAAPTRLRAWYDLRHSDPDFVAAAWSLTGGTLRGVRAPLLVTPDEVQLPQLGGTTGARQHEADAT